MLIRFSEVTWRAYRPHAGSGRGLTSGGLGYTDSGNKAVIGGIAREFYQRVKRHYDDPKAWVHETPAKYAAYRPKEDAM